MYKDRIFIFSKSILLYIVNSSFYDETSKRNVKPTPMTLLDVLFSMWTAHRIEWREELVFHYDEKSAVKICFA